MSYAVEDYGEFPVSEALLMLDQSMALTETELCEEVTKKQTQMR